MLRLVVSLILLLAIEAGACTEQFADLRRTTSDVLRVSNYVEAGNIGYRSIRQLTEAERRRATCTAEEMRLIRIGANAGLRGIRRVLRNLNSAIAREPNNRQLQTARRISNCIEQTIPTLTYLCNSSTLYGAFAGVIPPASNIVLISRVGTNSFFRRNRGENGRGGLIVHETAHKCGLWTDEYYSEGRTLRNYQGDWSRNEDTYAHWIHIGFCIPNASANLREFDCR